VGGRTASESLGSVWDRASSRYQSHCDGIEMALAWDTAAGRARSRRQHADRGARVRLEPDRVVYEANGVTVTSFPVVHALTGRRLPPRVRRALVLISGDACASWGSFTPTKAASTCSSTSASRRGRAPRPLRGLRSSGHDRAQRVHTSPTAGGQGVSPRQAGAWRAWTTAAFAPGHPHDQRELRASTDGPGSCRDRDVVTSSWFP